jgi:hypothetical protein
MKNESAGESDLRNVTENIDLPGGALPPSSCNGRVIGFTSLPG